MRLISATNAEDYLREQRWISSRERVQIRSLPGGVSNEVLYVGRLDRLGADFVLKQARPQLRTPQPWFSSVERIWREIDVLHVCQRVLLAEPIRPMTPPHTLLAATPRVLHEDRANYAFAMTAAPADHRVWKADLLGGRVEPIIAEACGHLLGRLHAGTWHDAQVAEQLDDRRLFDELRLDPYYRQVARVCPADAPVFERLIERVLAERHCLVHADFSPKNLLVYDGGLLLVDFETGHFGDPAFDLGFFLSHLVLKATYHAPGHRAYLALTTRFWEAYQAELKRVIADDLWRALQRRAIMNFAGCAWARLDGKSQIDYLTDENRRGVIRDICRTLLHQPVDDWQRVVDELHARLAR